MSEISTDTESARTDDRRRHLPAVNRLLDDPAVANLVALYGRDQVRVQARLELDALRRTLQQGGDAGDALRELERTPAQVLARRLEAALGTPLRRVLNATGILLHTNLGRAPLPRAVTASLPPFLDAYCDLEVDLSTGRRSDRNQRVGQLLAALTGADAGLVVNNNAAAMVLVLSTLAKGREVLVSRGELVEIGGSFRIPDILEMSGARLAEVGTTNRTRLGDYAARLHDDTGLLLKVFPSNYRIEGFTQAASPRQLAELARRHDVPLLVDEGSGLPRPHASPQLRDHASLQQLIADGCDLACGSGDKLLGGPQAGLLVGRADLVRRCRQHPLYRALRPDRTVLATLEAVLRRHLAGAPMPLDRLWPDTEAHQERLQRAAETLRRGGVETEILQADAYLGGGSAPESPIPGQALGVRAPLRKEQGAGQKPGSADSRVSPNEFAARLRQGATPVMGYVRGEVLILDLRTVDPDDDEALLAAVRAAATPAPSA